MDKKAIGVFQSEHDAIRKIEDLEAQGYDPSDIYAVAREEHDISMLRGQTNVDVRSGGGDWFDRFVRFMTGEEPVKEAMQNMELSGPDWSDIIRKLMTEEFFCMSIRNTVKGTAPVSIRDI
ncbi:general stress protein [Siminovitchia sp. FSL H7-0308]|uniref:General stress protein 17M-like domain-containing protein n=1 Tax=Siminovitchia thermophila TaxID=1245522 RepID=A0ABS2R6D3_9BACI|nr:general stress protein [Siminovitchia thermophila]MBM7714166.1 hypothetical protein [Siminovitchia thermophila]ONK24756.1 hypothetical protein BLX87_03705 [Bacillus sp. VT-16-64]